MEDFVFDKNSIALYAKKNTSPKFPLEEKYVNAFLDSLLNSSAVREKYKVLTDEMWNGNSYLFYNSFWKNAKIVNKEPNRSVVAYSMLKKDFRLFELMSASMFTGSVEEYHGSDLFNDVVRETDELPTKYTDSGSYTDMEEGIIQIGFKNVFCDDPLPDGTGSEFQTLEELNKAVSEFEIMATMCKPARVIFLLFFERYCFISGNRLKVDTCGINRDEFFSSPFGPDSGGAPNTGMDVLDSMDDVELEKCYQICSMYDADNNNLNLDYEREVIKGDGFVTFRYTFKAQQVNVGDKYITWGRIKMLPSTSSKIYVREKRYKEDEDHSEKMVPIMLYIRDTSDPDMPADAVLAFSLADNVAAMFYTREKAE